MAIAFKCPNCQQPYKVKDDMAGKRVVCTSCKKPIRVPAPVASPAVPHPEADALAAAALADAPAAPAEEAASSITVECPNCIEQVTFSADKAGKQAPCPNCKRIIRVPIPATGKKDWRTADARPTFARVQPEADLKGVVSTANIKVVDREALAEAGALRRRERPPLPVRTKVTYGIIAGCVVLLAIVGALLFRSNKVVERRDDLVLSAIKLVKDNTAIPTGVRAETYRAAGEYVLAQPDGKADAAKDYLANARGTLSAGKPPEQPFEKSALLSRIAVTQTGLIDPSRLRGAVRLDWPAGLQELRHTLQAFDNDPAQWEGTTVAVRDLARALGMKGAAPDRPAVIDLVLKRFNNPGEKADAIAAAALELFAAGDAG
ncbi:MAG TPA: hypothetical protein VH120_21575, partial [Gemmataceae bacterium]|nr:hypothetical protein [Gemmataceae bacterium]